MQENESIILILSDERRTVMSNTWLSEFFFKPAPLTCPICGNKVYLKDLSHYMGITGIEGCEWFVYRYDFVREMSVGCSRCCTMFKVSGSVFDGPDEGYLRSALKLEPLST